MIALCCGMPRSGSTLQFNVVWKVLEGASAGDKLEWRPASEWANGGGELLAAAVDPTMIYAIKTHNPPAELKQLVLDNGGCVVYCHRDLRDVVYSMKVKFGFTTSRALHRIGESLEVEGWIRAYSVGGGRVLVQEYEKLLLDLSVAIQEVEEFLNVSLSAEARERIVSELNIDTAYSESRARKVRFEHTRRRIGRVLGRKPAFANDELMLHPQHVSEHKGQIGAWRGHLQARELEEIDQKFGRRIMSGFDANG